MSSPLVLSLFPGIGLLDRAFEEEGFCVVRGPDLLWGGDIKEFHPPAGVFDGVIGGPPCQAFSRLASLVRANGSEPRFGNLIPEFERCVSEAYPKWFLMENVPAAPEPIIGGFWAQSFKLNNCWIDAGNGMGEEQSRLRRFTFGIRFDCGSAVNLMRWIDLAALELPRCSGTLVHALTPHQRDTVTSAHSIGKVKQQKNVVTSSDGGASVRMTRYTVSEACRLQGLPEDFLAEAPFTVAGKLKAVANGVPLPMGRAVARAIKKALGIDIDERQARNAT